MKISKKEKIESMKISHFDIGAEEEISLNSLEILVPYGTSPMALSAMLKGFESYFLKPSGSELPEEMKKSVEHNLEVLAKKLAAAAISAAPAEEAKESQSE